LFFFQGEFGRSGIDGDEGPRGPEALYFECRINKNALPQTIFWRFFPLGCHILLRIRAYCFVILCYKPAILLWHTSHVMLNKFLL